MDELQESISNRGTSAQERKTTQRSMDAVKIKTAVFDSGATSNFGMEGDDFILTKEKSNKIFHMPTGTTALAIVKAKLHHIVREPKRTVDMVPNLKHNSLMSARKFADSNYISVLKTTEVSVYDDMSNLHRSISSTVILRGWGCKHSGLWQVPITPVVLNNNTETMLIDQPNPEHAINSAYKFPSSEQLVRYLHACAGYPTKETWLKAIRSVNYLSWPGLTTKKFIWNHP